MFVTELTSRLSNAELIGSSAGSSSGKVDVSRATSDSRAVERGDVFVAVKGLRVDGHNYLEQAIASGASAVVVEQLNGELAVPVIRVASSAVALGEATAILMGDPAASLRLVGITGTNGKTTTTYAVESMIEAARRKAGVIGTVSYRYDGNETAAPYTTPTPEVFHAICKEMVDVSVDDVVLEVSSIALSMERLAGTSFAVAAFANLSQDHLDIHGSMEAYSAAKAKLFSERLADDGVAVINVDDAASPAMVTATQSRGRRRILRVSTNTENADAEIRVLDSTQTIEGISARVATPRGEIEIKTAALIGHYNLANLALAVGIGEAMELGQDAIVLGIQRMAGVPGRVERVANDQGLDILVDYAHTPDALSNVLAALRPLCAKRLICVFGCGGDRDKAKRSLMGAAAARDADLTIVTSDNPRTEDPHAIIDMILDAVPEPFYVEVARAIAIKAAVFEATPGDVVLIAGKGHEDYQILGDTTIPFDDRAHAFAAAEQRESLSLQTVADAVSGTVIGDGDLEASRVIIDGRIAAPGDLYVAIRGERVDGHNYTGQAFKSGAMAALVERGTVLDASTSRVVVEDTRAALGHLARHVRREWGRPVVGVTGSAGKTTTKGLIAAATRTLHPLASKGSLNNETGVPLTLLGLRSYHQLGIVEMGMRGLGQIDYLCSVAEPTVGVVVNAGVAHLGVIGTEEDIVVGKAEIYARLPKDGVAIFPADDPRLARFALAAPNRLSFGEATDADVRLLDYRSLGADGSAIRIAYQGQEHELAFALYGRHNAINAVCALAVAVSVDVSIEDALTGLASARPPGMRGQRVLAAGRSLLIDCYNSNPAALEAALKSIAELAAFSGNKAHAVIGDMLELGEHAEESHRQAGRVAGELKVDVVAVGEFAVAIAEGTRSVGGEAELAKDPTEAANRVWKRSKSGDWVLFKASRGAKLERAVDAVRELAAEAD